MSSQVPEGYKQTEVGVIPEDWDVRQLEDIVEQQRPISYGIVQTGPNLPIGIPCLRVVDIHDGRIDRTELIHTSQKISDGYKRTVLEQNDLVMPLRGKVGDVGIIDAELKGANLTRGVALIAVRPDFSSKFCLYAISWPQTRRRLEQSMNGSALQEISIANLRSFQIGIPLSFSEQKAIASTLSNIDNLLASLDQLIAKKRDLKQATMQQLLTGEKRLPGFGEEKGWRETKIGMLPVDWLTPNLGDLFVFKNGLNKEKKFFGYGTPIVNYMDVFKTPGLNASDILGKVFVSSDEVRAYEVKKGDVFFTRTSETVEEIGITTVLLEDVLNGVFSGFVLRARTRNSKFELDLSFKKYCFSSEIIRQQITATSSYTTRALTNGRLLSQVILPCPSNLHEQTAIARILTDIDTELTTLQTRRTKTQALKQAMMQQLLTGQTRLI